MEEEPPMLDTPDTSDGIEVTESHEAGLENFLYVCGVVSEDINTHMGLTEAGVESWSDLIPSVQMTKGHLVMQGIDRNVAGKLLARAQYHHWKMSQFIPQSIPPKLSPCYPPRQRPRCERPFVVCKTIQNIDSSATEPNTNFLNTLAHKPTPVWHDQKPIDPITDPSETQKPNITMIFGPII
ncbi:hypothetical protein DFH28DRAFT_924305 [Melampsora americana]|nr:hypothetical protein DFH28DRAFT_924305 [Melampsora americana]